MDPSKHLGLAALVELDRDHPGFRDPSYRRRRDAIAALALAYREGDPAPRVAYTPEEHDVWATVFRELDPLHEEHACRAYLDAREVLRLDRACVPQLEEVNAAIASHGLRLSPVAGLVSPRRFMEFLGRGAFLATQYMRHPSTPLYTPEPDVIHELIGHAVTFADPTFVRLNRLFGEAAARADDEAIEGLIRLYWFTLEFGLVEEEGALKACGAGLLSSYGELSRHGNAAEHRPFDVAAIERTPFDPTDYQQVLFVAPSFEVLADALSERLSRA